MKYHSIASILVFALIGCSSSNTPDAAGVIDGHVAAIDGHVAVVDSHPTVIDSAAQPLADANPNAPDAQPNLCVLTLSGDESAGTYHCGAGATQTTSPDYTTYEVGIENESNQVIGYIQITDVPGDVQDSSTIVANALSWSLRFQDPVRGTFEGMGPSNPVGSVSMSVTSHLVTSTTSSGATDLIHGSAMAVIPNAADSNLSITVNATF